MRNVFQINAENFNDRHKRKAVWHRILSVLCGIIVFCTTYAMILPAITLEEPAPETAEGDSSVSGEDPDDLVMTKQIKYDEETGGFTLRIESYVTGSTQITTKTEPVDVVLVLDASGSMEYDSSTMNVYTPVYSVSTNSSYYVLENGSYKRVRYCSECKGWFDTNHSSGACGGHVDDANKGTQYVPKTFAAAETGTTFYSGDNLSYMEALKDAANEFIANMARISPDNRVAVVKFANGEDRYVVKDVTQTGNSSGYTQVVSGLTTLTASNIKTLESSVNKISASGDTASDWGMYLANQLLKNARDAGNKAGKYDRKQIVVMFTDGEPNHGGSSDFNTTVANDAIANSTELTKTGATVYTIGCFNNADATVYDPKTTGWSKLSNANKYMNLVSSNFPEATSMTNIGTPAYPKDKSYYRVISDSNSISAEFESISVEIGVAAIQLDETSELKDYIAEQYNLAESDTKTVTVHTETYTGKDDKGNLLWTDDKNGPRPEGLTVSVLDDVEQKGASGLVSVTGFDYSEYYVDLENTGTAHVGKKLVVEIPIKASEDSDVTGAVKTNAPGSGIYYNDEPAGDLPYPDIQVPAIINVSLEGKYEADITTNVISISASGTTDAVAYLEAAKEFTDHILLSDTTKTDFTLGGSNLTQQLYAIDHIAMDEAPTDVVYDISNIPENYALFAQLDDAEPVPLTVLDGKASYTMQPTGTMDLKFILSYTPFLKLVVENETLGTDEDVSFEYNVLYLDYDGETVSKDFTLKKNTGTNSLDPVLAELESIPMNAVVTVKETTHDGFKVLVRNADNTATLADDDTYTFTMSDNAKVIIQNTAGDPLPSTGSAGRLVMYIVGIALMAFAVICALFLLFKSRRKSE